MHKYPRQISGRIGSKLFRGKAIVIYGPRQVGKTTLVQDLLSTLNEKVLSLNCDNPDVRDLLQDQNEFALKQLIGSHRIVFVDEAQRVKNVGLTLKLLVDNFDSVQVIASGSSAMELANEMSEPLTGRKFSFKLLPISIMEYFGGELNPLEFKRVLPSLLVYGSYPEVLTLEENSEKEELIRELSADALFKDIYTFQQIKNPSVLRTLLKALAFQVGSEVSNNELAGMVGIDKNTVESYIDLLEKNFIVFRVPSLSRNLRNELKKSRKIYFVDLGIRNALINNFNALEDRNDLGALWENFCVLERIKYQEYHPLPSNNYFWRTYDAAEIDWIEEWGGKLHAFEMKWNPKKKVKAPPLMGKGLSKLRLAAYSSRKRLPADRVASVPPKLAGGSTKHGHNARQHLISVGTDQARCTTRDPSLRGGGPMGSPSNRGAVVYQFESARSRVAPGSC
jgi:hypothetical protein